MHLWHSSRVAGPLCDVKTELLFEYQKASMEYSKAVSELCRYAGSLPYVEYQRVRLIAERARQVCAAARDALRAHTIEHGC
jgi:hypothetical protein